jgi:anti-sigma factor RsiW
MPFDPTADEDQARAVTRLVDNTLSDAEKPAVEAWANERPEISRQIADQRGVADALRGGGPEPPERLVAAVRDRVQASDQRRTRLTAPAWLSSRPGLRPVLGGAALAAVCAVVALVVVAIVPGSSSPSIPAAARLAFAPSTGGAPAARNARLLDISYAGITYPNYAQFAVHPSGQRTDRIGGRPALTVFYRLPNGARLSYTVFSGKPVRLPRAARPVVFEGVPLRTFSTRSGLAVVTLVRFGRTCVLAAPTRRDLVLALAAAPVKEQPA